LKKEARKKDSSGSPEKPKARKSRRFVCDSCGAREFEITVEPMYTEHVQPDGAADWLDDACYCPVCGGQVEESL
jgi:rubredoxin